MGDRAHAGRHLPLWEFLQERGVALGDAGSSERGLRREDALAFLDLVDRLEVNLLGLEPWRATARGYEVESLGVWSADGPAVRSNLEDARQHLISLRLAPEDIVTFQF